MIYSFQDDYALVEKDGKFGIIDTALSEIIEPALDNYIGYDVSPYFFDSWFYGIRNDSLIVYDTSGSILHHYRLDTELTPNLLSDQSYFIDQLKVKTENDRYLYSGSKNWGCLASNGDTIIPFQFENIYEGLKGTLIATRGGAKNLETYLYSHSGDTLRRTYNVPILPWEINDYYFFVQPSEYIQIRNTSFEIIDTVYCQDIVVNENYTWLKSDNQWYRYDTRLTRKDGPYEHVIQNKFWGAIWKNQHVAIINQKGEITTPFIYEGKNHEYTSTSKFIVAKNKRQIHILNARGELVQTIKRKKTTNAD